MNISSLIDNKIRSRPSDKKVIEFRQKPESIVYLVSCWLAASAIENWLSRKEEHCSPLLAQNLLEFWLDERESPKAYLSTAGINDEVRFKLLSFLQKTESRGSLFEQLEIDFDNLCQEYHYLIAQEGGNKFLSRIKEQGCFIIG